MTSVDIIAELGSTHDGSVHTAIEMVRLYANLGATTIKLQDHAEQRIPAAQQHPSPRVHERRRDYYRRLEFSSVDWQKLMAACRAARVRSMVSVFAAKRVRELPYEPDAIKIASGEVGNLALLRAASDSGWPVHISLGMASAAEASAAVRVLGPSLACVMHCTSLYPCPAAHVDLQQLTRYAAAWPVPIGYSDHTMGVAASLGAVMLGASSVERHVCLSREQYGSDAAHSLEPHEFAKFVHELRDLEVMRRRPLQSTSRAVAATRRAYWSGK